MCGGAGKRVRVLVVDDDHGQRTVLRSTLAKVGYQVDTAEDGVEAVKAVGRVAYDVVLMDGFMPNKTGWEATKEIRSEELARGDKKRLVIIGVTGATSREDEDKCFASGMTDVISKPVKREALQAKIEQWTTVTAASPAPKDEAAATVREETKAQQPASGNRQALIVSKDKSMQVMLKGVFKPIGIVCVFCDSQAKCMEKIAELGAGNIELMLVDPAVPNLDVLSTLNQVRKVVDGESSELLPIFAISSEDDAPKMRLMGFSDVVHKPINADAIRKTVLNYQEGAANKEAPAEAPEPRKDNKEEVRVLIVEDHWANRRLLEAMLKKQGPGFTMEAVENGQEAVNIADSRQYDIILMDCNMPIMDGWQATEKIRQTDGPNKLTPIIAVTANAMKGDREKCIQAGMDDYISKPVERKRLEEVLSKWLASDK